MNAAARVETNCPLEGRLKSFQWLYWWLEYWGQWARSGGARGSTPLALLLEYGDERIVETNPGSFPRDIELLEKGLGRLRLSSHFQWQVLAYHHIGRNSFREIVRMYDIRQRGLERTMWHAYSFLDDQYRRNAPHFMTKSAPLAG